MVLLYGMTIPIGEGLLVGKVTPSERGKETLMQMLDNEVAWGAGMILPVDADLGAR